MQEDFKKNYILLSKFAKEKKYAQEYLGLLARRGDLGSIRIGKRWYTSQEWFSEFLADAEKRKTEAARILLENNAAKISEQSLVSLVSEVPIPEMKKETNPTLETKFIAEEEIVVSVAGNVKEYIGDDPLSETSLPVKIKIPESAKRREIVSKQTAIKPMDFMPRRSSSSTVSPISRVENKQPEFFSAENYSRGVDLRSRIKIRRLERQTDKITPRFSDIKMSSEKKLERRRENHQIEIPPHEKILKIRRSDNVFSPSFAERKGLASLLFPKFAFGLAAVLLFFMLFQAAILHKEDLMRIAGFSQASGIVAGASNERGNGVTDIKSEADYYLSSSADAMKESISFSRLMIRIALEKSNNR